MGPEELYMESKAVASAMNECQDCTVRAVAIATGEGYDMAHYAVEEHGRERGRGASISAMQSACADMGYTMVRVDRRAYQDRAKTALTASRLGWKGAFILSFSGHVAAMVDARVYDWAAGSRKRIQNIYRIEPAA